MSHTKRLISEIQEIENESCKKITPSNLYIIKIKLDNVLSFDEIRQLSVDELHADPQPLAVHFTNNEIALIFSYVAENYLPTVNCEKFSHQLTGNHHHIVSKYASKYANLIPRTKIIVTIIEFQTQIQLISYFGLNAFQISQNALLSLSNGKINEDLLQFRTQFELKDLLYDKTGIKWDDVSSHTKYGTFLKLKRKKKDIIVSEMSELFDARENKKYSKFIFG